MKDLFDPRQADEIRQRLQSLKAETPPKWGTMSVGQAAAHCSVGIEIALGDRRPPRRFVSWVLGPIFKRLVLGDDQPMQPGSPTVPGMTVTDPRDLDVERDRLLKLIDRFVREGPSGCTDHPHSYFGRLRPDQWAVLQYKHLDHHLRQFDA